MEDIILKLCKDVLANGSNDPKVSCYKLECEQCIFCSDNRSDMFGCHENDEADIKIAKQYIKEHTPISEIERTFREVIADIKEGEVWESAQNCFQLKEINCIEGRIKFKLEGVFVEKTDNLNNVNTGEGSGQTFKLQRKQYTFDEAFKAYEEGKEIQSASTDKIYHKEKDFLFASYEISKKWYINN